MGGEMLLLMALSGATGFVFGALFQICQTDKDWERDLIKRGLAQYNPTTGKWEWK